MESLAPLIHTEFEEKAPAERGPSLVKLTPMGTAKRAAQTVVDESNPVSFMRRLREMPLLKRIFAVIDRFL